jgi:hypothetical protein
LYLQLFAADSFVFGCIITGDEEELLVAVLLVDGILDELLEEEAESVEEMDGLLDDSIINGFFAILTDI